MKRFREAIRNCEAMAIKRDADILAMFIEPVVANETRGGAVIVNIRGPLEHHDCDADRDREKDPLPRYGDSYEAIRERFGEALESDAECIILRIDSPGGVVSGLNQAVYDMTRAKEASGKHIVVYVDELCASAAYALACVGDEIVIPPSGIAGSVGVISTMCDQVKADEKAGLNFVTITSGARKDDGHPHTAISEDAIKVEQRRVSRLAKQFFAIVKRARGIDAEPLQAGIFLGAEAVAKGIADEVMGWEEMLVDIADVYGSGNPVAQTGTSEPAGEPDMLKQKALIKRLAAETNPKKRAALAAQLSSSLQAGTKKTYKKMEEEETEETTGEEEEEEGNETDREEDDMPGDEPDKDDKKESKKAAKAKSPMGEEEEAVEDDEERAESEDEEEEASAETEDDEEEAVAALLGGLRGRKAETARGYLAALKADAKRGRRADAQVRKLAAAQERTQLHASIDGRLAKRHITRSEAKWLKTQPKATVDSFLKTRKSPIVMTEDDAETQRNPSAGINPTAGVGADFGKEQLEVFQKISAATNIPVEKLIENYRTNATAPNGARAADLTFTKGMQLPGGN